MNYWLVQKLKKPYLKYPRTPKTNFNQFCYSQFEFHSHLIILGGRTLEFFENNVFEDGVNLLLLGKDHLLGHVLELVLAVVHEVHAVDLVLGLGEEELVEVVVLRFLDGFDEVVHGVILARLVQRRESLTPIEQTGILGNEIDGFSDTLN